jgi:signal transduction histidine kinase
LRKTDDAAEIDRNAHIIGEQADRITQIVRQLLDFARRKGPVKRPIDATDLLRGTSELLETTVRKHNAVELTTLEPAPGLVVAVDTVQLQQVLANLVLNAAQAMPNGGSVSVAAERYDGDPPHTHSGSATSWVRIVVRDTGVGIRSEDLPRIFEPFFTTKEIGEGTGLGLSVVHGIVQEHGGWIDVESERGAGTCFSVYLPRVAEDVRAA